MNQITVKYPVWDFDKNWHDTEVRGCYDDGESVIWADDDNPAEFWSVYLRLNDGTAQCIADFHTEREAVRFSKMILSISKNYKP